MSRTTRLGAAAVAVLALALPLPAQAAPTPAAAPAAATSPIAFAPAATLGFAAQSVAATTDLTAYVAGVSGTTARVQLATRTATGVTLADVALPAGVVATSGVQVVADGGRAYAFVPGAYPGRARLFALSGTTATELVVPATGPNGAGIELRTIALDGPTSIWLGGLVLMGPLAPPTAVQVHGDGRAWSLVPTRPDTLETPLRSYAVAGHYYEVFSPGMSRSLAHAAAEWTGSQWQARPTTGYSFNGVHGYADEWTFASTSDYTMWGEGVQTTPQLPPAGSCARVVDGAKVDGGCVAPAWPVSAATRLADGRIVLGGSDAVQVGSTAYPFPGGAGFAVVATDGAAPVAVPGDNGDRVVDLTASWPGTTVWALTSAGGTVSLQVSGAPVTRRSWHRTPQPPQAKRRPSTGYTVRW